jgi:hypothetical protein
MDLEGAGGGQGGHPVHLQPAQTPKAAQADVDLGPGQHQAALQENLHAVDDLAVEQVLLVGVRGLGREPRPGGGGSAAAAGRRHDGQLIASGGQPLAGLGSDLYTHAHLAGFVVSRVMGMPDGIPLVLLYQPVLASPGGKICMAEALRSQYYKNRLARSFMNKQQREDLLAQRSELIEEVEQARAALPAHSVRPWQWQRVEDAEEALAEVDRKLEELEDD